MGLNGTKSIDFAGKLELGSALILANIISYKSF